MSRRYTIKPWCDKVQEEIILVSISRWFKLSGQIYQTNAINVLTTSYPSNIPL